MRARNGRLHRVHQGVYAVGHPQLTFEGRFLAAVKACGSRAALGGFAAAGLWSFVDWDGERYPEVVVAAQWAPARAGIRVRRTHWLGPRDVTRHRGVPVTTPARTLLDLAAEVPERALRRAVRRAQGMRLVSVTQVLDQLERAGSRRGVRALRRAVATGPAPTRSELEDVVLDLILRGGIEHPQVNVPIVVAGRRLVPDFRWPAARLIVEADGAAWHDGPIARGDDGERQALLEAAGERVVRVSWRQAVESPGRTLARLRAAGAPPATSATSAC